MQGIELLAPYKIIIIPILLFLFSPLIFSQSYPDSTVNNLLSSGIWEITNQDYDSASNYFRQLDSKYPNLPLGKIYLAAADIAKSYDLGERFNSDFINANLIAAKKLSKELVEKDGNNIWYNYFLALSDGYSAYFSAINKSWLAAFSEGLSARSDFEKCLKLDPKFYDAYIAIGAYKYWKSRKTEFLEWLPFVKDEEQSGINFLQIAIAHASYNTNVAISSLIWIYIDRKEYNDAAKLAQEALKQFPENRFFLWGLARAYENIDKDTSIKIYLRVLNSYMMIPNQNHYQEIILKHIIAQLYQKTGDSQKALAFCNNILSIKDLSSRVSKELSSRLERVRKLRDELVH